MKSEQGSEESKQYVIKIHNSNVGSPKHRPHSWQSESHLSVINKIPYDSNSSGSKESIFESNVMLLGQQVGKNKGKKTLVINLDETICHCIFEVN
jgi:hypothetical protein